MKCISKIIGLCSLIVSIAANAALTHTSVHSRANCFNNESITWWAGHPYPWRVVSLHFHKETDTMHKIDTGFHNQDRVAAVHWGEGVHGGWVVWGYHYLLPDFENVPFDTTFADGCNIIDGWY